MTKFTWALRRSVSGKSERGVALNFHYIEVIYSTVGEQQTLNFADEQLQEKLAQLGTPEALNYDAITEQIGFHCEVNVQFMV